MPDDQFEPKMLALFERLTRALEEIALNTKPTPQQLQQQPIKWSAIFEPEQKPPVPVRAIRPEERTPDMPPW